MVIKKLKINGVTKPVGFSFKNLKISWSVEDFTDKYQKETLIEVSETKDFQEICFSKKGKLNSICEKLELELMPRTRYFFKIKVVGENGETAVSETSYFETGKMDEKWEGEFIGTKDEDSFHPMFIKEFLVEKEVETAKVYINGLGLYEAYINGNKIGEDYLAPFVNDYNEEIQYQTYDISDKIYAKNKIEIITGNGWYKGRFGLDGGKENIYGDKFSIIAEIHILYKDGTNQKIVTDDSWTYCGSDIEESGIYDGEKLNRELYKNIENPIKKVEILNLDKNKLVERFSLPLKVMDELKVIEVIETPKGETVLDMGQNFSGYIEFKSKLPASTRIELHFGEILQDNNFYNDNYRGAAKPFIYISDGREEVVRPHFTYFGFRYVKVVGWSSEINPDDFIGKVVYSQQETTSFIETSNKKLNKLASNCIWGQRSNFLDMPTDCPQRDERLGWTGDAQVFAPTACFNMDTRMFYDKFLHDLRLDQVKNNGAVANYLPNIAFIPSGSSVWGDVATFVPMELFEHYGDKYALEEYFPLMKDWVDYIIEKDKENGEHNLFDFGFHFGDWLALDGATPQSFKGSTDDYFIASVYYYASAMKVSKAAGIIGKKSEETYYYEKSLKIKEAIFREYFTKSGRLAIDTQTAYYISLKFQIYIEKERIINGLKERLKKDCYKIKGGFVGAPIMCQVMADNGLEDLAYFILLQENFPGWMNCINLGATTIWERWNSVLQDGKISGTGMNSLNHYAYGSVLEFVYKNAAGIKNTKPGFKEVMFKPQLNNKLQYLNYRYSSVAGDYVSNWKINKDGKLTFHFEVPFEGKAKAELPDYDGGIIELEPGKHDITYKPKKDYTSLFNIDARLEELKDSEEAMKIIKEDLPIAAGMIEGGNLEDLSRSLNELQFMFFMGFNPELINKAAEKLFKIKAF